MTLGSLVVSSPVIVECHFHCVLPGMLSFKICLTLSSAARFCALLQGHDCHHGHGGHSHSHGSRPAPAFMANFHSKGGDQAMGLSQQPKKRSHMDDSSSWDIVKASQ